MGSPSFSAFVAAIEKDEMAIAASLLRQFKSLKPGQIEEICDLLDPNLPKKQARHSPYKLVRARRDLGRPAVTPTVKLAENIEASAMVAREIAKGTNLKTALYKLSAKKKISTSSAKRMYQAGRKIKRPSWLKK